MDLNSIHVSDHPDNITREKPERLELVMLPIRQSTPAPATMPANPDPKSQFRVGDRAIRKPGKSSLNPLARFATMTP